MITDLIVTNFQSWEDVQLELAPITVIVGKGDRGKSALLRAMVCALTNQGGDDFIRRGADKATVAMNINGHSLVWEKARGKGGEYDLDGVKFTKTGQSVPQEIQDATGFRALEVDKNYSVMPNVHEQFDPPFLVFESGSRTARILGKLTKVDTLVNAQIAARRDLKASETALSVAEQSIKSITGDLALLPDEKALRHEFNQVQQAVQEADELSNTRDRLRAAVRTYRAATRQAVDFSGLAAEHNKAFTAYAFWADAVDALERHYRAVASLADAALGLDVATEKLAQLKAEYEAACESVGVCEVCPWK